MATLKNTVINDTGYIQVAVGTTAQRPSAAAGLIRYNTTTGKYEVSHASGAWTVVGEVGLPINNGLTVVYDSANNWDTTNNRWTDTSGNNNHTSNTTGTINIGTHNGSGLGSTKTFNYIYGNTASGVRITNGWNNGGAYTFFHVSRYTGGTRERIWQGNSGNWLSGHWYGGSGRFYHEGWMSSSSTNYHGDDWFLTMDQNAFVRTNKGANTFSSGGNYSPNGVSINNAGSGGCCHGEASDWACAFVAVYNRNLTSAEYTEVENWIWNKYF